MAGSSLLTLIDDIASLLDDIALMTKVAAKKTAGVLGDDLALNAQQVSGVSADRELPVVWAVAKGSFKNKLILVPAALLISAFAAWAIAPLLMLGGAFLCFEGFEKIVHQFLHTEAKDHQSSNNATDNKNTDVTGYEQDKIKGAIRTDFVLSAEIIVITLGTVASEPFTRQIAVLASIAILMTVGVYGLVAGIVKLDDGGLQLSKAEGNGLYSQSKRTIGKQILNAAPYLMRSLSVIGTAAMFMVGGGILVHGIAPLHEAINQFLENSTANGGHILSLVAKPLIDALLGVLTGALVMTLVSVTKKLIPKKAH